MRNPTAPLSIGIGVGLAISLMVASVVTLPAAPAQSREPNRTLKLFFGHTGEKGEFTFKRNGNYDRGELRRINHLLRDWRRDEDARMDPQLLDLIWAIYKQSGSNDYIHVVSAYRSPTTNEMLRKRSSGVAKNSQHRLGKAMDWYLPDVPLAKLRGIAMKMQGGGVGYYPRSGSPFVHTDTGNVRAWPRMTRQQLLALFPNGNTLHLPADGKPLPGYEIALAKRKASGGTALAYLDVGSSDDDEAADRTGTDNSSSGWLRRVFPGSGRKAEAVAAASPPASADDPPPAASSPASADALPPAAAEEMQPPIVAASLQDEDMPRPPRARPAGEVAAADAPIDAIVLASVDAQATEVASDVSLPRMRPALESDVQPAANAEDAIASLAERMSQESPLSTTPEAADPVALAFAAASQSPEPSEADRAILMTFASLNQSDAVRPADALLVDAITRLASRQADEPQQPVRLAVVQSADLPPSLPSHLSRRCRTRRAPAS